MIPVVSPPKAKMKKTYTKEWLSPDEQTDWAWLAGIIDGEGCITITGAQRGWGWQDILYLGIGMTHKPTIDRIVEIIGAGKCHQFDPMKVKSMRGGKIFYSWYAINKTAGQIIRLCFPFLVTKKAQAEIALEYDIILRQCKQKAYHPYPPCGKALRKYYYRKIRELNGRVKKCAV